jgi:hypothetical protein
MSDRKRPSTGTVLGLLALFVALGGTALAATGQLVNIADGTNAAYLAKVDSTGALKTTTTAPPTPPAKTFSAETLAYDAAAIQYNALFPATSATIAINRIVLAPHRNSTIAREVRLYQFWVPAGATCDIANLYAYKELAVYRVNAETLTDVMPTPLVFKPQSGRPWCLALNLGPSGADSNNFLFVNLSGWVVSGTPPAGTSFRSGATRPKGQADPAAPLREAVEANR